MALRVAMTHGEFISDGLGVGAKKGEHERSSTVTWGNMTLIVEKHNRGVDRGKQKKTWILETQEQKQINKNRMSTVA
jgi:hypothetical protein